jgi:mono/diheme cytochrome c family protein
VGATHSIGQTPPAGAPTPSEDNSHIDQIARGRTLFADSGCGTCHALHDAEATGTIGPSLDGNNFLTEKLVIARVTDGQGPMPSFGGQLSDQEIADLAVYVTHVAAK